MERKKAEIIAHYNNIIQNKDSVISNLNNIVKEIENATNMMDTVSMSELRQSKHLLNLMKYELSFMKVLSEMSYLVETFMEEEELPLLSRTRSSLSLTCSRTSSVCEDVDNRMDIVTLKEQFMQLHEKIQTSCPAVLEYVANYYRHPLNNTPLNDGRPNGGFVIPSTSVHPFGNHYEVPEKDQIKTETVQILEHSKIERTIDSIRENGSSNLSDVPQVDALPLVTLNCDYEEQDVHIEPKVEALIDIEEGDNTIREINNTESNLVQGSLKKITLRPDDSESDSEIIEIMEGRTQNTADRASDTTSSTSGSTSSNTTSSSMSAPSSVLDKLNNFKVHDRREHAMKKLNPTFVPDLSLKPLLEDENVNGVKVNFCSGSKLKKQKNQSANYSSMTEMDLPDFEVPKEGQEVVFSHVETPSEFYIHLVNDQVKNIDKIAEQIHVYYDDSAPIFNTKTEARALSRNYCVAYVVNSWYRVEIVDWLMDDSLKDDRVLVYLVDFGDKHKVSFTVLRHMPLEVEKIPKLAVRCHLVCLYPPDSTYSNLLTEWPDQSIKELEDLAGLTTREDTKFFRIMYADKTGDSVAVDLINDRDRESVGQILLDIHAAVQVVNAEFADEDENLNTFLDGDENLVEADDITEAIQGYSAKDEARVCKFARSGKVCYRGDKCPYEHIDLTKDGFTTDTVLVHMDAFSLLHLPSIGSQVIILVTGFIDLCRFYVHLVHNPVNMGNHLIDKSLYDLIEVMNHIDLTKIYSTFKIWPAIGEIVAVKHWATKKWLRGKVRHLIMDEDGQPNAAQIFMVDFGEIVDVPFTCMRQINQDFLHLPFQAVEIYLHEVQQRKDVDNETAHKFFLENMCLKNFNATIMSSVEPLRVSVVTMKNINISRTLLRLNLVEDKQEDLCPAEGCYIQPA